MKELRFAWNGRVMSREDTRMIMLTIIIMTISALVVIGGVIFDLIKVTGE